MREIKFRAWIPRISKMEEVTGIEWVFNEETEKFDGGIDIITRSMQIRDDPILMQYTGLKDKNGKKIFEGDIVKEVDSNWWDGIVRWHNEGSIGWGVEPLREEDKCRGWYGLNTNYSFEIIGNIHESPELLERK